MATDIEGALGQLQQQNAELVRTLTALLKDVDDLKRQVAEVQRDYYRHSHAALDALPS